MVIDSFSPLSAKICSVEKKLSVHTWHLSNNAHNTISLIVLKIHTNCIQTFAYSCLKKKRDNSYRFWNLQPFLSLTQSGFHMTKILAKIGMYCFIVLRSDMKHQLKIIRRDVIWNWCKRKEPNRKSYSDKNDDDNDEDDIIAKKQTNRKKMWREK